MRQKSVIRNTKTEGLGNIELAKIFKVTKENISSIVLRKTWKHI